MATLFHSLNDPELIAQLQRGAVGVIPTDTVYGLVSSVLSPGAVARLYALKSRDHKPGTVIAANVEQLSKLGIKPKYLDVASRFWPGPVSIETPHDIEYLHQGTGRQAFRIPSDPGVHALLLKTGPLQTTSANLPGSDPAADYAASRTFFGDRIDFYVDGGNLADRPPSTIIRITDDGDVEVIREGSVRVTKNGLVS